MKKLIYITGPTASGKTDLAIDVAKQIGGEIIGADSMQIYKYISVGTAKPKKEEIENIKYHLIDFVEPDCIYTVDNFKNDALSLINNMHSRNVTPIVCGGTGLYINSILYEMDFTNASYSLELREELLKKDRDSLLEMLKEKDRATYDIIDKNNLRRIVRALEICLLSGQPKSAQTGDYKQNLRPFDHRVIVLNPNRDILYERINKRVNQMIKSGLIEEVKMLLERYKNTDFPVFQFIGYKEIVEYLNGKTSKQTAIEKIKQNTRRFAKRQMTWFRGLKGIKSLHYIDSSILSKQQLLENILEITE